MTGRIKALAEKALTQYKKAIDIKPYAHFFNNDTETANVQKKADCINYYLNHDLPSVDNHSLLIGNAQLSALGAIPGFNEQTDIDAQKIGHQWILGGNHKTADFEFVLKNGMRGYAEKIQASLAQYNRDVKKCALLNAMKTVLDGILDYADNCADACLKAALEQTDEIRKNELFALCEICKKVPQNPAKTFYEAVQSYWFIIMLFPDGLGRLDQYLYPFYQKDIQSGAITKEVALELIENLFIFVFVTEGIGHEWSALNHMVVGGYLANGEDGYNELTEMILQAIRDLPTYRPQVTFRRTKKTTPEQLYHVVDAMENRFDLIMITNDYVMIPGITSLGIPFEAAVDYSLSGCNEMVITGKSQMGSLEGHINIVTALEKTIYSTLLKTTFD